MMTFGATMVGRARRIVGGGIRLLPLKRQLLRLGATLPPGLKGRGQLRCLAALHARTSFPAGASLRTNFGVAARYDLRIPASGDRVYLYGSLNDHRGERGSVQLAQILASRARAFVDVGAHLGLYVFSVREAVPGLPIYYFEPSPALFRILEANVARNYLAGVTGYPCAIGRSTGRARWFENVSDSLSSSLTDMFRATHETIETEVDTMSFAELCRSEGLDDLCVKVDIEGAEFEFLEGAGDALGQVTFLIMEVLGPAIREGFVATLQRAGMNAYYINDFRLEHSVDGTFRYVPPQHNWLFCRLPPSALRELLGHTPFTIG